MMQTIILFPDILQGTFAQEAPAAATEHDW